MGFFAKLKQMFSHNIVYDPNIDEDLAVLYSGKIVNLKCGANIVIEDDACCVVVYKHNPKDFLCGKGKYRICSDVMPNLFKSVISKKNKSPKSIKAKLYFVKIGFVDRFVFQSNCNFVLKSADYGKIVGGVEGICKINIINIRDFFDWLFLNKRDFKVGEIDDLVSAEIGNLICKVLEKSKIDIREIVLRHHNLNEYLDMELNGVFDKLGFEIKDIEVKGMEFNSKSKEKIDAILQRQYERLDRTETKYVTLTTVNGENKIESFVETNTDYKTCRNCGNLLQGEYDFCPHCGMQVK